MRAALPLTTALGLALAADAFRTPCTISTRRYTTQPHMALASALDRPLERFNGLLRLVNELNDDLFLAPVNKRTTEIGGPLGAIGSFKVDLKETDQAYVVRADMPGVTKDDVKITMNEGVLAITAERREERHSEMPTEPTKADENAEGSVNDVLQQAEAKPDVKYHFSEVTYGKVYRAFKLPSDADADAIKANLDSGVLTVTLPKKESPRERTVEIQ